MWKRSIPTLLELLKQDTTRDKQSLKFVNTIYQELSELKVKISIFRQVWKSHLDNLAEVCKIWSFEIKLIFILRRI